MHVHRYGHARAQIGLAQVSHAHVRIFHACAQIDHARAKIGQARAWIGHARARVGYARSQIVVHSLTQIAHACALIGHTWIDHAQYVIHPHTCRTHEVRAVRDIQGFALHMLIHSICGIHIAAIVFCLKDKSEKLHLFNTRLWHRGAETVLKFFMT